MPVVLTGIGFDILFGRGTRHRHDALAGDLHPVSERRTDVIRLQLSIGGEDLGLALATDGPHVTPKKSHPRKRMAK